MFSSSEEENLHEAFEQLTLTQPPSSTVIVEQWNSKLGSFAPPCSFKANDFVNFGTLLPPSTNQAYGCFLCELSRQVGLPRQIEEYVGVMDLTSVDLHSKNTIIFPAYLPQPSGGAIFLLGEFLSNNSAQDLIFKSGLLLYVDPPPCQVALNRKDKELNLFEVQSYDELLGKVDDEIQDAAFFPYALLITDENEIHTLEGLPESTTILMTRLNSKGFSDFSEDDARAYAKLDCGTIPVDPGHFDDPLDNKVTMNPRFNRLVTHVVNDLEYKAIVLNHSSECSVQQFIDATLIAAGVLVKRGFKFELICERNIVGTLGKGPVDYAFVYESSPIVLTEVKRNDTDTGLKQNLAQIVAGREEYARNQIKDMRIVTTGNQWILLKYYYSDGHWIVVKSHLLLLNYRKAINMDVTDLLTREVSVLLSTIGKMLLDQMDFIDELKSNVLKRPRTKTFLSSSSIAL
eukprot:gene9535-19828_t